MGGKNPMAGSMGSILVILLLSTVERHKPGTPFRNLVLLGIMSTIVLAAFIFAKSRGYTLGLFAAILLLGVGAFLMDWTRNRLSSRSAIFAGALIALLGAGAVVMGDRYEDALEDDPNVTNRFALWDRAGDLFLRSPVIGFGLGSFQQVEASIEDVIPGLLAVKVGGYYLEKHREHDPFGGEHVHNALLQMMVDGGIVYVGLLFAAMGLALTRASQVLRWPAGQPVDDPILACARFNARVSICLFVYLAVSGVTAGFTFVSPTMSWVFFIALARLVRHHHYLRERWLQAGVGVARR
jgi:O-antigen ligase